LDGISIGNVSFWDWSHVENIVDGYILLVEESRFGDVYVQSSMRTNSVLTYILLTLQHLSYDVREVETLKGEKRVKNPTEVSDEDFFNTKFMKTRVDSLMLRGKLEYILEDARLRVHQQFLNVLC
jgi:GDPmannose 4,6-dehydratase